MHYLIDGYNLLFYFFPQVHDILANSNLVHEKIQQLLSPFKGNATVVLDSFIKDGSPNPFRTKLGKIEIVYTPSHQTADDYILECLQANPRNQIVVSSDRELILRAKNLGAQTIKVIDFFAHLKKKSRRNKSEELMHYKYSQETRENIDRLLEIFEAGIQNE